MKKIHSCYYCDIFMKKYEKTMIYNKMIEGNADAKTEWLKIIETDIKEQEKQQKILF